MRKIATLFLLLISFWLGGCKQTHLQKANELYESRDFKEALFHYEKACLEGEIYACKMTASLYQEDKHAITSSKAKAIKALEFACQYGDLPSCQIVYKAYELLGLKKLAQQTLEYACKGGEASSCLKLALALYSPKKFETSLELATKSCYGGEERGCKLAITLLQKFDPKSTRLGGLQKQLELLLQS